MVKGYQDWVLAGEPDSGLILPMQYTMDVLQARGYLVYAKPNQSHRLSVPPEDHTEFSQTNFPGGQELWWRHAFDIMPTKGGPDLWALGKMIVAHKRAGLIPWLKYVNVPTDSSLTGAVEYRWEWGEESGPSSDTGHIHASGYTGFISSTVQYNPFGGVVVTNEEREVQAVENAQETVSLDVGGGKMQDFPVPFTKRLDAIEGKLDAVLEAVKAGRTVVAGDIPVAGTLHIQQSS